MSLIGYFNLVVPQPNPFKFRINHAIESSTCQTVFEISSDLCIKMEVFLSIIQNATEYKTIQRLFNLSTQRVSFCLLEVDLQIKFAICRIAPQSADM